MGKKVLFSILAGCIFFLSAISTISDYNIMWDARGHFLRGQAFLNFLLTGKGSYENMPLTQDYARYYRDYVSQDSPNRDITKLVSKDPSYRRSIYQDQINSGFFNNLIEGKTLGHPPLSDIASASFNKIFYEKLGLLRDDHAYAFYSIVLASVLVAVFFYWICSLYGFFPAVVSAVTLVTTPLFWAESHNNIKDIPQLAFFSLAIWAFWKGIIGKSKKWIIVSAFVAGCALGTKFNILFVPFIVVPWFALYFFKSSFSARKIYLGWWWIFLSYPIIMFAVFFFTWPQLWYTPTNLLNVFGYYKDIGTNIDYTPAFRTLFGFNTYAPLWILYTTFPAVVVLSLVGIIAWIVRLKKTKDFLPFLFLLWLIVPILRVSLPNTAIYGGVRQIMEYIPALSFFAGYGAYMLSFLFSARFKTLFYFLIVLCFFPLILTLFRLHPAENAYFNSLIGGLQGAKEAKLTGWGNTNGGIYEVAVAWLNKNAEPNSHVAVGFSETADFYIPEFRQDLLVDNQFSGYLQKGEYIVALTHDSGLEHTYGLRYPERFLDPVYVYAVDDVPLIKIWKNDKSHLKREFSEKIYTNMNLMPRQVGDELRWGLDKKRQIMAVEIEFNENNSCKSLDNAIFQISEDGQTWEILPETYPGGPLNFLGNQPKDNKLIAPMAGVIASEISFSVDPVGSCILNVKKSKIKVLE